MGGNAIAFSAVGGSVDMSLFSASPATGESIEASGIPVSLGGDTGGCWVASGSAGAAKVPTGGQMMAPRAEVVVKVCPG